MTTFRVAGPISPCLPTCSRTANSTASTSIHIWWNELTPFGHSTRTESAREHHPVSHSLVPPESVSWSLPTFSHRLYNLSGKTTFLLYYLVRELARGQPTMYFFKGYLYIFTQDGPHRINVNQAPEFEIAWKFATCLVDADVTHAPPDSLMTHAPLFIVAASSPTSPHRRWVKWRADSWEFALTPPTPNELVQALVWSFIPSSRCSQSLVSLVWTCPCAPYRTFKMRSRIMGSTCGGSGMCFAMVANRSSMESRRESSDFRLPISIPLSDSMPMIPGMCPNPPRKSMS